ncbi:MAG: potassium-transporting ATPase subunit KdpA [Planctomycetota bacterium]
MNPVGWLQVALYVALLAAIAGPLAAYLVRVYDGRPSLLTRVLGPLERGLCRLAGVDPARERGWRAYARDLLAFNLLGFLAVYGLQRLQHVLPGNPAALPAVAPDLAFDTAISFMTNTNFQSYGGETTMSHLTQMLALTVQNFVSAATGLAVLVALVRGFARREAETLGDFRADLVRSTLYVLLPLSLVLAVFLVSQGVVQTHGGTVDATLLDPVPAADGAVRTTQRIAVGPAASQVAIKQLGTNGGGFFNPNGAHPFENPTPLSGLVQMLAILALGAALPLAFGRLLGRARDGRALLLAMFVLFVPAVVATCVAESTPSAAFARADVDGGGGNLEGKEVRFGVAGSATWAAATTAASNGSVNSMHDAYRPLGGLVPMVLMQLGEVVFGGVGSGLYGMVVFALVAVFVAGLMIGRTPEYLGKKLEAFEMKMASLVILAPAAVVLVGTAIAAVHPAGRAGIGNPGAHGFGELLYAFSSAGNNNGSAFAGLSTNTPFFNVALAVAMFVGRFVPALATLAIAGSLARKKSVPAGAGTLPTHGPLFVGLLVATVLLVGALTFVPALALGPVVEHLQATR